MIERIQICGYKSLNGINLRLKPLSVFFGPNAAGKSNFLDALQLLSRIATSRTLKEAFEPPYRGKALESFTFDNGGIKGLLDRDNAAFSIEVDIRLSPKIIEGVNKQIKEMRQSKTETPSGAQGRVSSHSSLVRENYLRYRIVIEILPKFGFLRVVDEYLAALNKKGEPTGSRSPFLERVENRLHLRMERQAHPTFYDIGLDHSVLSLPLYPPHHPHMVAAREELASWFFFYFEPRERMRAASPVKEVRHIGLMGEDLAAFLNTLKNLDPSQFKAVEKALQMIIPSVSGLNIDVNNLGEVEIQLLEGKLPVPARLLSEGTLRVLGLLALGGAKEPPSVIGFEEPENGIHPRRIRLIADYFNAHAGSGDTQIIITTHSPILPDLIPDESLFVFRKIKGETKIVPFETWGELSRRRSIEESMDKEELPISQRILRGDFDD